MAEVVLEGVTKVYPGGTEAVSDLDLAIRDGELMVLVGPSGCGKTTALRMVAGLEDITAGKLRIGDRVVNDVAPKDRDVAMVFQTYALYPHLTVADNIAFGLKLRKVPKAEINQRVGEAARVLGLEELLHRRPRELSGGQRQRVAMGRAIVREPQVFLMDEPLSNLDAKLRVQTRVEIARIQRRLGVTTVYVTHDQTEAMTLGDRVAVMRRGVLQQVDPPQVLYERPVNLFVGGFIGSPSMNILEATVDANGDGAWLQLGSQRLRVDDALAEAASLPSHNGRKLAVGIRPEDMESASVLTEHPPDRRLRSSAELVEALGSEIFVHFSVDAPTVVTEHTVDLAADVGVEAVEDLHDQAAQARTAVVARFSPRVKVAAGDPVEVAVDTSRLYFFDPDTGLALGGWLG